MLIIDTHAHIYSPDEKRYPPIDKPLRPPGGKGSLEDLQRESRANGVKAVCAIQTSTFYRFDNRYICDSARTHKDWIAGVCTLDPDDPHSSGLLQQFVRDYSIGGMRSIPAKNGQLNHSGVRALWKTGLEQGIVINLAAMRLFYFPKAKPGELQKVITHPIGIGRVGWRTPGGNTKIVAKTEAPVWTPTAAIRKEHAADGDPLPKVVPPGPDNPLGTHLLKLGWPEYAIHGTDKPPSVGLRGTHGCLRLYPEDIVGIYDAVPVGTPVTVVNQPFLVGWRGDTLVMQTFPVLEDDKRTHRPEQLINLALKKSTQGKQGARSKLVVNDALVTEMTQNPRAVAVPISAANLTLERYLAAALRVENKLPLNQLWDGDMSRQLTAADAMKAAKTP